MGFPPQGTDGRTGLLEVEKSFAPTDENPAVPIHVITADQSLGPRDITVDIPAGAQIVSVIAMARINIMNNAATAQTIDLKLEVSVDGGAATQLFSQYDVVGFGAVIGASAVYVIAEDASDEVTADGQVVTLDALATLSAPAPFPTSVRFQAQYYLFITYRLS